MTSIDSHLSSALELLRTDYQNLSFLSRELDNIVIQDSNHNLHLSGRTLVNNELSEFLLREMNKKIESIQDLVTIVRKATNDRDSNVQFKEEITENFQKCPEEMKTKRRRRKRRVKRKRSQIPTNAYQSCERQQQLAVLREMKSFNAIVRRKETF